MNKIALTGVAAFLIIVMILLLTPIENKIVKQPEPIVLMYTWDDGLGDYCEQWNGLYPVMYLQVKTVEGGQASTS